MNFRYALEDAWRYVPYASLIVRHALWDLVLGVVAVLLAWLFVGSLKWTVGWRKGVCWFTGLLWITFLPNAAYLIVSIRSIPDVSYFIFNASAHNLIDGTRRATASLLWVFFYAGVALVGAGLYGAAIHPIQRHCITNRKSNFILCLLISFATAVGVELGLNHRFNTWDLLRRPVPIAQSAWEGLASPTVETLFVVLFTGILAGLWYLTWVFGAGLTEIVANRKSKLTVGEPLTD